MRDTTFFVLNGTSTANQIVAHSAIVAGDVVLADRNCHKSLNYALAITDAIPVYLRAVRNGYGIIGPIPATALTARPDRRVDRRPPARRASPPTGLRCTRRSRTRPTTGSATTPAGRPSCSARACRGSTSTRPGSPTRRFNPLYRDRFAMHVTADAEHADAVRDPVDAQAARRVLAGLDDPHPLERAGPGRAGRFNEAYMMHGSTSPFYPMIAVLDVAAAMMDGPRGTTLTGESIREAIDFRKRVSSLASSDRRA